MSIIIFIIILVILILAHEFGHFIVAKAVGMRVDEFGIGFPPKIKGWKRKKSETEYSLNWVPFGGFVRIFGEDGVREGSQSSTDEGGGSLTSDERAFINKPKWAQASVIVAGVVFNVLFAWILISAGFMSGLPTPVGAAPTGAAVENARLVITAISADSPALASGLKPGDSVVAITSTEGALQENVTPETVSEFISTHGGEEIAVLYARGEERGTAFVTPQDGVLEGRPAIGITMDMIGILKLPFYQAFWEGAKTTISLTAFIAVGFWDLITGAITGNGPGLSSVTGPVGIVGLVGDASDFGFIYLLGFTAFISINLAIINLIPFPALDGGRLLFLIIETIKRSPIKPVVVNTANTIGFILLILLMVVVTFNDIVRLF